MFILKFFRCLLAFTFICCLSFNTIQAQELHADLYVIGSNQSQSQGKWHMKSQRIGNKLFPYHVIFTNTDGVKTTEEIITFKENLFHSYTCIRHNIGETITVTMAADHIEYKRLFENTETIKKRELATNFLAGPLIVPYIQKHINDLKKGNVHNIEYAAISHLRTIAFELKIEKELSTADRLVFKFNPKNFLFNKFVDPIYFYLSPSGDILYEIVGRTAAVTRDNDTIIALDSHYIFKPMIYTR